MPGARKRRPIGLLLFGLRRRREAFLVFDLGGSAQGLEPVLHELARLLAPDRHHGDWTRGLARKRRWLARCDYAGNHHVADGDHERFTRGHGSQTAIETGWNDARIE